MHVAVPPAIVGPSSFVWSVEALEFGVCTHLELLNASVHLSLNKDSSDSMNSWNKDVSNSFLFDSFKFFFGSYGGNLVLEDFKISQSFAKFKSIVSVVCLSMNLYSWHDLVGKQCWHLLFTSVTAVIWSLTNELWHFFSLFFCKVTSRYFVWHIFVSDAPICW